MSKQTQIVCDLCKKPITESDYLVIRIATTQKKHGPDTKGGRPPAVEEKLLDCHWSCVSEKGLPIPDVIVKEAPSV